MRELFNHHPVSYFMPSLMPSCRWPLVMVVLAVGCTTSDRPPLAPVSGHVTHEGEPLAGATVVFAPVAGGRTSRGITDEAGRYELTYLRDIRGAILGDHVVAITTARENEPETLLPARYHEASELRATLGPGSNTCDFAL